MTFSPQGQVEDRIIVLSNHLSGARWSPLYFIFDRSKLISSSGGDLGPEPTVNGIGARLITWSAGRLSKRLIAIYYVNFAWMIFDGTREILMRDADVTWSQGGLLSRALNMATLTIRTVDYEGTIRYFRPSIRQSFEGGWSLDDVDVAWLISRYVKNDAALLRLMQAF